MVRVPKNEFINATPHDSVKRLIYNKKRRFSASSSYMAGHIVQSTDFLYMDSKDKIHQF